MSIGMEQCAPTGLGTGDERERVFAQLADGWNEEKEQIKQMSEEDVRRNLTCP